MRKTIGEIKSLWRYPVKSLLGEKCNSVDIEIRGIVGDRKFAITTLDGKIGSGKNTQRFKRIDGLFSMSATRTGKGVLIKFPDGNVLTDQFENIDKKLSTLLGQTVALTLETNIPHFDKGSVHLLTTNSLQLLKNLSPPLSIDERSIDERRFRPNIVVNTCVDVSDKELVGKILKMGQTTLKITGHYERCRMVTLAHSDLDYNPKLLKRISKDFNLNFGIYADVVETGVISIKDKVTIT